DAQVARLHPVEGRERPAEDVVEPAELVRPLERHDVDRLLDDADEGVVAPLVEADAAELLLGQVAALAAEADALLDLLERRRERERLLLRPLEDVEGEALRRPRADPGQAGQLRDEVLDGRAEHRAIVPRHPGQGPGGALRVGPDARGCHDRHMDAQRLANVELFSSLSKRDLEKLATWTDEMTFPAG